MDEDFEEFQTAVAEQKTTSVNEIAQDDSDCWRLDTQTPEINDSVSSTTTKNLIPENREKHKEEIPNVHHDESDSYDETISETLRNTVDEVVRRRSLEMMRESSSDPMYSTTTTELTKTDQEINEDFADFANFQTTDSSAECAINDDDDDDFGDFDQADFSPGVFAEQRSLPLPPEGNCQEDGTAAATISPLEISPISCVIFREIIEQSFLATDEPCAVQTVETESFQACVERDFARCENVDDWECVVFRFESSNTRKALLAALCIDETPANCPRFALDCLKEAFLQPVRETTTERCDSSSQQLTERTKEVLGKIPDLSFMEAEVLTFPATIQAP